MGSVIQSFVCFALIVIGGTSELGMDRRIKSLIAILFLEQSDLKTCVKDFKTDIDPIIGIEMQSLKNTLDACTSNSDLKTSLIEILQCKIEDLELQISLLPSNDNKCEATWSQYRESCYKYFDKIKTYDQAKKACAHEHAFLVDVNDKQEMKFLTSLVDNATKHLADYFKSFWLGLSNKGNRGSWISERTGDKATYLNWAPGEPREIGADFDVPLPNMIHLMISGRT